MRPASRVRRALIGVLIAATAFAATSAHAEFSIIGSTDAPGSFGMTAFAATDDRIFIDYSTGVFARNSMLTLPGGVGLDALHDFSSPNVGGSRGAFSIDTTAELAPGFVATDGDVLSWDGATLTILVCNACGSPVLPEDVGVDAVSAFFYSPFPSNAEFILSFDRSVDFGAFQADDEDLVLFDGSSYALLWDLSTLGVDESLNVDAAHLFVPGGFFVSFSESGSIGGLAFDDEDVLAYDDVTQAWSIEYDGSVADPSWVDGDLDALFFLPEPGFGACLLLGALALAGTRPAAPPA